MKLISKSRKKETFNTSLPHDETYAFWIICPVNYQKTEKIMKTCESMQNKSKPQTNQNTNIKSNLATKKKKCIVNL